MERKWKKKKTKRRNERRDCLVLGMSIMNSFEFISTYINLICTQVHFHFTIYNSSQMSAHLTNLKPNGLKSITKVNILFEIHTMVSGVIVFDKIRRNSYLRKRPCITLSKYKININHSTSFKFISSNSNQSFETNSIQFYHKPQLA